MENQNWIISPKSIKRLRVQGLTQLSDNELGRHRMGIRFAYQACVTIFILGLLFSSIPVLSILMVIAFIGAIHSRHPFDYIYNYGLRHYFKKPMLPRRAIQTRFACGVATLLIASVIYFIYNGNMVGAYIAGAVLIFSAVLVSTTDICIPSMIYNAIFKQEPRPGCLDPE